MYSKKAWVMTTKLGINIDHIATLRQLRATPYPNILEAARIVERAGGDQITVHLREDRRHIQDEDVKILKKNLKIDLNLEMAVTPAMQKFAMKIKPDWVCLVPEKRQEVTTEGGLDLLNGRARVDQIGRCVLALKLMGIKVSLFVEPDSKTIEKAKALGANAVEIHTGTYAIETQRTKPNKTLVRKQYERIIEALKLARHLGLGPHVGHGLDYANVRPLVDAHHSGAVKIDEYNIGHSIVCRAAIVGLERAVREMVSAVRAP